MKQVLLILQTIAVQIQRVHGYPEDIFERMEYMGSEGDEFKCQFDGATIAIGFVSSDPNMPSTEFDKFCFINLQSTEIMTCQENQSPINLVHLQVDYTPLTI